MARTRAQLARKGRGVNRPATMARWLAMNSVKIGAFLNGPPAWRPLPAWGWSRALLVGALIFIAAQALGVGGAMLLGVPGFGTTPADQESGSGAVLMSVLLLSQVAVSGLTLLAAGASRIGMEGTLGLGAPAGGGATYVLSLLLMVPVLAVINGLAFIANPTDPFSDLRQFFDIARSPNPLVPALAIGLGAPLSEELLFRGLLLRPLAATRLGFWPTAVLVCLAWTALHWGYSAVGLAEVFAIGLFLSWVLWRTGSLRVPILCHALYNSVLFAVLRYGPF